MAGARFKEFMKKYGKTALGVHFSVSAASITGLYVAIKNNVDVESMLEKAGLPNLVNKKEEAAEVPNLPSSMSDELPASGTFVVDESPELSTANSDNNLNTSNRPCKRNRTAELAASSGGALALAVLLNKALFPVRVPITIALTPPIARFLARRSIIKNSV